MSYAGQGTSMLTFEGPNYVITSQPVRFAFSEHLGTQGTDKVTYFLIIAAYPELRLTVILTHRKKDNVVVTSGIGERHTYLCLFVLIRVDGQPLVLIDIKLSTRRRKGGSLHDFELGRGRGIGLDHRVSGSAAK